MGGFYMLTAADIKNVSFTKSLNGFKREEVEVFLDRVESDLAQYEKIIKDYQLKIESLESQIDDFKKSQDNIQNVLINAQKLADKIISDARVQSEEIVLKAEENINIITARERELADAFEMKANERKNALQVELDAMIEKANIKAKSIADATDDCVRRQQVLFDKLRLEIAAFKSAVTGKYKEHLSILQDIPDTVQMDPQQMAAVLAAKIDEEPNVMEFMPSSKEAEQVQDVVETIEESSGFIIGDSETDTTQG